MILAWLGPTRYRLRRRVIESARLARGQCITCGMRMCAPRCDECRAKAAKRSARWRRRNPERATQWGKRDEAANPAKYRARERADYAARKLIKQCTRCGDDAAEDSNDCAYHRDLNRKYSREYQRRKAA